MSKTKKAPSKQLYAYHNCLLCGGENPDSNCSACAYIEQRERYNEKVLSVLEDVRWKYVQNITVHGQNVFHVGTLKQSGVHQTAPYARCWTHYDHK